MSEVIFYGPLSGNVNTAQAKGLPTASFKVAVDGGSVSNADFNLWVGDGDSGHPPPGVEALWKTNQDETDFGYALRHIDQKPWTTIHLVGFWGGRRDHELAILGELNSVLKTHQGRRVVLYNEVFEPIAEMFTPGSHSISFHGIFSALALEEGFLSLSGNIQFSANKTLLKPLSGQGISNRAEGDFSFACTMPLLILRTSSHS
jgi:thiamine pyrophosphokinase